MVADMNHFLDLRRVRYIVAISDHGSISAAARILNVAQPALSYHLAEMERLIGAVLFERHPTGMTPTTTGLVFIEHGRLILEAARVADEDIQRQIAGVRHQRKTIRLAIIPSLASMMTPMLIDAFGTHMPDKILHVIDARTSFADELIEDGKADLAIKLVPTLNFGEEPLAWERLCCVMRVEDGTGPITFADAAKTRLILPSKENPLRRFLENEAEKLGIVLNVTMEIDGFEPRKRVVLSGHGTTIIGGRSVPSDNLAPHLTARPIVEPDLQRPIVLKCRAGLDARIGLTVRDLLAEIFRRGE